MKKTIAAGALGAIALTSISAVSANVTGASVPTQEIAQVADIEVSKADILASLKTEISALTDKKFQGKMSKSVEALAKITDDVTFDTEIHKIFAELDSHYGYPVNEANGLADMAELKKELASDLSEELKYVKDTKVVKQITAMITELASSKDEDSLFTKLDSVYDALDAHYKTLGEDMPELDEDMSFNDAKKEILEFLADDIVSLKEDGLDISANVKKLAGITNENEFFTTLDALSNTIEKHLEKVEDAYDDTEIEVKDGDFSEFEEDNNSDDSSDENEDTNVKSDEDFDDIEKLEYKENLELDKGEEDESVKSDENFDDIEKLEYKENLELDKDEEDESVKSDDNFDDIEKASDK